MADNSVRDLIISAYSDEGCFVGGGHNGAVHLIPELGDYVVKSRKFNCIDTVVAALSRTTMLSQMPQMLGSRNMGQAVLCSKTDPQTYFALQILQRKDGQSLERD